MASRLHTIRVIKLYVSDGEKELSEDNEYFRRAAVGPETADKVAHKQLSTISSTIYQIRKLFHVKLTEICKYYVITN